MMRTISDMDIPKPVEPTFKASEIAIPIVYASILGLSSYVILFLIMVSLALPALITFRPDFSNSIDSSFSPLVPAWIAIASLLFVIEAYISDNTLKTLKHNALRGGIVAGTIVVLLLIALAPIIFTDDFSRSSLMSLLLLLVSPFLGLVAGSWFASRRS